ncbi:MAG: hypothetical protein ACE15D_00290 [Candidatus Eisenbacteria bacterium]|nr:hypothetical protein [Candidatus Eisenbacteria bacterium]
MHRTIDRQTRKRPPRRQPSLNDAPAPAQAPRPPAASEIERAREAFLAGGIDRALKLYGRLVPSESVARADLRAMLALLDRLVEPDRELLQRRERLRRKLLSMILS